MQGQRKRKPRLDRIDPTADRENLVSVLPSVERRTGILGKERGDLIFTDRRIVFIGASNKLTFKSDIDTEPEPMLRGCVLMSREEITTMNPNNVVIELADIESFKVNEVHKCTGCTANCRELNNFLEIYTGDKCYRPLNRRQ